MIIHPLILAFGNDVNDCFLGCSACDPEHVLQQRRDQVGSRFEGRAS
jgi:hypothetical protein